MQKQSTTTEDQQVHENSNDAKNYPPTAGPEKIIPKVIIEKSLSGEGLSNIQINNVDLKSIEQLFLIADQTMTWFDLDQSNLAVELLKRIHQRERQRNENPLYRFFWRTALKMEKREPLKVYKIEDKDKPLTVDFRIENASPYNAQHLFEIFEAIRKSFYIPPGEFIAVLMDQMKSKSEAPKPPSDRKNYQ